MGLVLIAACLGSCERGWFYPSAVHLRRLIITWCTFAYSPVHFWEEKRGRRIRIGRALKTSPLSKLEITCSLFCNGYRHSVMHRAQALVRRKANAKQFQFCKRACFGESHGIIFYWNVSILFIYSIANSYFKSITWQKNSTRKILRKYSKFWTLSKKMI